MKAARRRPRVDQTQAAVEARVGQGTRPVSLWTESSSTPISSISLPISKSRGWRAYLILDDVELLTSPYGLEEGRRNLAMARPEAVTRLERLCNAITTVNLPQGLKLPTHVHLDDNDQPILLAAIHGRDHYLLTGDARHFAHLYESASRPYSYCDRHSIFTRRRCL